MYDITIIGAGATGLCLLLLLQEAVAAATAAATAATTVAPRIAIIDPHFDGGDLVRLWGPIESNTPWSKTSDAIVAACPLSKPPFPVPMGLTSDKTTPLWQLGSALRTAVAAAMTTLNPYKVQGWATQIEWKSSDAAWTIEVGPTTLKSRAVVLVPGGKPKGLNLPIPSIPLTVALAGAERLRSYVTKGQRVMVFGTAHSGTFVMRNLVRDCSASVVGLYNTEKPFYWDRDGAYDGIKAEAAEVADAIVAGRLPGVQLTPVQDTSAVIRAAAEADWVVYAMGFQPRIAGLTAKVNGVEKSLRAYDGATGVLQDLPAAWGFGIAYPNRAPDGIHWDVSVAAFLAHMKPQVGVILAAAMQK